MLDQTLEILTLGNFYIALVLDGLQRMSGLFMWEILKTMSVDRKDAALPFTTSWASANIVASFSGNLLPENEEYIKIIGVLMTATGAGLSLFATDSFLLIISWGFIFGSGYGLLRPHLSKQLKNLNCVKLLPILETTPSLGVAVMPFILCIMNSYYSLPGSYLLFSGIILNYLPLSVAAAYNVKFSIPNIKWRVQKRSSQYCVSKQAEDKIVSNESFINCLEPDLIFKISQSEGYENKINEKSCNSFEQGTSNDDKKMSKKIVCDLKDLSTDIRLIDRHKTNFERDEEVLEPKQKIEVLENFSHNNMFIYEEIKNDFKQASIQCHELKNNEPTVFKIEAFNTVTNSKCVVDGPNKSSLLFENDQNCKTVSINNTLLNYSVKDGKIRQFIDNNQSDMNLSSKEKEKCALYIETYNTTHANTTSNSLNIIYKEQVEHSIKITDTPKKTFKNKYYKNNTNEESKNENKEYLAVGDKKTEALANIQTLNEFFQSNDENTIINSTKIDINLRNEIEQNKLTICNNTGNASPLSSNLNYESQILCSTEKNLEFPSKYVENKKVLHMPLDIKVHVIECNLSGDEEDWVPNLERKYLRSGKNDYRQHSNSMLPGTYDCIDFTSLSKIKRNSSLSEYDKPKLLNIFSISEKVDLKTSTNSSERSEKQSKTFNIMVEIKMFLKFLHYMATPISLCIILITIVLEFNLITLITIFADFGNDIDNKFSNHKWILISFGMGGLIGKFCCCKISRTIPEQSHSIGVILFLLTGLSIAGILFSPNLYWLAGFYCILGALESGIRYTIPKFIIKHIDRDAQSKLFASKSCLSGIAIMTIPYLIGLSRDEFGDYDFLLQILSVSSVLCALLIYFLPQISKTIDNRNKCTA